MKGLRKYLTPFAPDQSGAVSVFYESVMREAVSAMSADLMNQDGSQGKALFSVPG